MWRRYPIRHRMAPSRLDSLSLRRGKHVEFTSSGLRDARNDVAATAHQSRTTCGARSRYRAVGLASGEITAGDRARRRHSPAHGATLKPMLTHSERYQVIVDLQKPVSASRHGKMPRAQIKRTSAREASWLSGVHDRMQSIPSLSFLRVVVLSSCALPLVACGALNSVMGKAQPGGAAAGNAAEPGSSSGNSTSGGSSPGGSSSSGSAASGKSGSCAERVAALASKPLAGKYLQASCISGSMQCDAKTPIMQGLKSNGCFHEFEQKTRRVRRAGCTWQN
jgi:hypothetical protein